MNDQEFYEKVFFSVLPILLKKATTFDSASDLAREADAYAQAMLEQRNRFIDSQPKGYPPSR